MELMGIIVGIIGLVLGVYFGFKSLAISRSEEKSIKGPDQELSIVRSSSIPSGEEYKEKREGALSAIDQLTKLDTEKYTPDAMVEKMLAEEVKRLHYDLDVENHRTLEALREKSELQVRFAVLQEKYRFQRTTEWIRNFVGICMGITAGLFFTGEPSEQKLWGIFTVCLAIVFIITCIYSFSTREKT